MIIFTQQRSRMSAIDRLKYKAFVKSMREITDAEIIAMDPDPLKAKAQLDNKVTDDGTKQ